MEWLIGIYLAIGVLRTIKRMSATAPDRPIWMNLERNRIKFAALFTVHALLWPLWLGGGSGTVHHESPTASQPPVRSSQPSGPIPTRAPSEFNFFSVIALCLVGAIVSASMHKEIQGVSLGFTFGSKVGWFLGAFAALVAAAGLGFGLTWIIKAIRAASSGVATIFAGLMFYGLSVQWEPTTNLLASAPLAQQSQPTVPAIEASELRQAYDRAVQEIERKHPRLNPDSPEFDKKLAPIILNRAKEYAQRGLTPHDAVWQAVRDYEVPEKPKQEPVQSFARPPNEPYGSSASALRAVRPSVLLGELASDEREVINLLCRTAATPDNLESAKCVTSELAKLAESEHGSKEMRAWRKECWSRLPSDLETYVRATCNGQKELGIVPYVGCLKQAFVAVTQK